MDLFLPIHDMLHGLLGQKLCCWPGVFGFCPEFWLGFLSAWVIVKTKPQTKLYEVFKSITKKKKETEKEKEEE